MGAGPTFPGGGDRQSPLEIESETATRHEHARLSREDLKRKNSPLSLLSHQLAYRDSPALAAMHPLSEPVVGTAKLNPPSLGTGEGTADSVPAGQPKPANDR